MPTATAPKPLHIFKPGQWTTTAGEVIAFSESDLQATARAYDPKKSKAPLVVGHPKTDAPAQGWAASLSVSDRGLLAVADKVDPEFAEEVRAGRWGTISAKFYRPTEPGNPVPGVWYLRHIGFLGAQPPAVKGLDDPEFAEADDGCVCFQEGVAFADATAPGPAAAAALHPTPPQPPQESTVTEEEAARLREDSAAKDRQIAELQARDAERTAAGVRADNVAFAEQMAAETRILPTHVAQVVAIGTQLQTTPDVQFGEGDAKKPLGEAFRDFVRSLPTQVEFGEQATRERATATGVQDADVEFAEGADPERVKQHKAALAYAKEHKTTYAAAARAVIK